MNIGCVILAGGHSSRMGTDKALLEINGKRFIGAIADEMSFFAEKYIARGAMEEITEGTWQVIPDIYPDCGPLGGLHAALTACKSDALLCVPCDMPLIGAELANELCAHLSEEYDAVIVKDTDGRIHPVCGIYKKTAADVIEQQLLTGNYRMMHVLDRLRITYVIPDDPMKEKQLSNINTPEDLRMLKMETENP